MDKRKKQDFHLRKRSLITHYNPRSAIAEQYRSIRTNIQFASLEKEAKVITITSALPGEGKSTTAANLAIVLAQQDCRVLLIDADMRKPTTHYTFLLDNYFGLTHVLLGAKSLSEVKKHTMIDYLDVLTSGPTPPNPTELIAMKKFDSMLKEAKLLYEYIIIDTPPILAVSDAQILSKKTDGVVLVVCSNKTKIEDSIKAKELIRQVDGNILGAVLNRKKRNRQEINYYYDVK